MGIDGVVYDTIKQPFEELHIDLKPQNAQSRTVQVRRSLYKDRVYPQCNCDLLDLVPLPFWASTSSACLPVDPGLRIQWGTGIQIRGPDSQSLDWENVIYVRKRSH